MTYEQAVDRMTAIHQKLSAISDKGHRAQLSKADYREFDDLTSEFESLDRHRQDLERAQQIASAARGGGDGLRLERADGGINPYTPRAATTGDPHRDAALRTLERSVKAGLPAAGAEIVERLLDNGPDVERSWTSRWVTDCGSSHYRSAFAKILYHGEQRAGLEFTPAERSALERVSRLRAELRAMSLTDSAGGFMIPFELDPAIAITNAGSTSPLLQISRVISTISDVWHGVSSAGVQASWDAEASEVSDDSPALAEPQIPAYKAAAFVPFSIEVQGDAIALLSEIGKLINDGLTNLLNQALTVGGGVGGPTGIVTALAGTSSVVGASSAGTITAEDVYNLQSSLGPRWQANARWIGSLNVINTLRRMQTANGSHEFPSLQNDPPTLLGRPVHEASDMDNTIAAGKNLLVYGDFSNFVVTQRVGSSVELIPHLFAPANNRPTGQRGLYAWARWGSDSINDAAFRMLAA